MVIIEKLEIQNNKTIAGQERTLANKEKHHLKVLDCFICFVSLLFPPIVPNTAGKFRSSSWDSAFTRTHLPPIYSGNLQILESPRGDLDAYLMASEAKVALKLSAHKSTDT